jgi:hypothetical protein
LIFFKPMTEQHEWDWVYSRAYPIRCIDTQGIVAFNEKGEIKAICVADSFTPDACQVHVAIDSPTVIRRGFFNEVFRHLFIQCGRSRVFGLVPADNAAALKLNKHMGFTEVARIPHGYSEEVDYVILSMDKASCRWLNSPKTAPQRIEQEKAA